MDPKDYETSNYSSPDEEVVFGAAIRQVVDELRVSPKDIEISYGQAQARIHSATTKLARETIQEKPRRTLNGSVRLFSPPQRGVWYVLAGAVVGMLVIVAGWHPGALRLSGLSGHRQMAMSLYVTGNGERANITLPDGNTVALNVASRLGVPSDYLAGNHTVRLTGEAVFTIRHHDGTPFTVLAGPATARVLGTSFLVRHYPVDGATTVAVHDGKVAVHSAELKPVVLTSARELVIDKVGSASVQSADPAQFGFVTGVLTLKSVPFPLAIVELNRWYDADIRLGDPALKGLRVTGECAAGSLTDLSSILELTFNVRVVRNGRVLTLFPR